MKETLTGRDTQLGFRGHYSSKKRYRRCLIYPSHVICADCEFEMCFTHQVKWHEGLSCEQFDSKGNRRSGVPTDSRVDQD